MTNARGRTGPPTVKPFHASEVRGDFPILKQVINGKPLVYLDNAATSQKPQAVLDALQRYYLTENANVHRGVHTLSARATEDYEGARTKVRKFLNAREDAEIIFTRGTTEAINLVASSYGRKYLGPGDEVVITAMEHHSNIVPWQMLCEEKGATLRVVPINDAGELLMDEYDKLLSKRTRIVSVVHVSNSLGTVNPVRDIIARAHAVGAPVLLDGAQSTPHLPVDLQALGCDFYAFSGHKVCGPTGIGVLYGRREFLDAMPPYQGGGDMIKSVTFARTIYADLPAKFEAGTPDIAGAVGLGAAIDYLTAIGLDRIHAYEDELLAYGTGLLSRIEGLRLIGTARDKASVLAFTLKDIHPHDIGTVLDQDGIAIRTGHHCTQPVMERFGIAATARASLGLFNTREDLDALVKGLDKVLEVFG
ncbi:MAG: cysteine desulfurase [SAR202 cluster bacterium]|nr:cysteine desulfurase [SAR202 cluster bacterium]